MEGDAELQGLTRGKVEVEEVLKRRGNREPTSRAALFFFAVVVHGVC